MQDERSDRPDAIQIVHRAEKKRVDVYIDGAHFTSYLFSEAGSDLKKPILYPLNTANGNNVARGWPFERKAGERVDHPHHAGHWFNYGDVNGFDFWNHSTNTPGDRLDKMGSIVHQSVDAIKNGNDVGTLTVTAHWLGPDGAALLHEQTTFVFTKAADRRIMDRTTTLTALDEPVVFSDNKEGMVAVRVTRALEHPSNEALLLTDEDGQPRAEKVRDNTGVSGEYLNEAGVRGTAIWGERSPWALLSGKLDDEHVTITIIDHPQNPGYPTYWHARGYGLFAANPLGQRIFSKGKEMLNHSLEPGASTTFRYRIAFLSDSADPQKAVKTLAADFAAKTLE
ncbi:MAG: PmoA family protein [Bacteroidota bacterium]